MLPEKAQLEPIFNRLAEDREHVKISKMWQPQPECVRQPEEACSVKVLVCATACSSQAGCENPEGSDLWVKTRSCPVFSALLS